MAERLVLPTSDHGVAGLNPAGGKILPEPKRRFIAQSLSYSPFHRLEMTEILLKGCKTLTHPSIQLKMLKYPLKHYSNILWYPIENVHTQFTKKVVCTYPMPSKLWAFTFFRTIRIDGWTKYVGINCFIKTYYFTLKYDDLQRTNPEYLEDEMSQNWIPVGTRIYDNGSGKIHHQNKMAERVDIIF